MKKKTGFQNGSSYNVTAAISWASKQFRSMGRCASSVQDELDAYNAPHKIEFETPLTQERSFFFLPLKLIMDSGFSPERCG